MRMGINNCGEMIKGTVVWRSRLCLVLILLSYGLSGCSLATEEGGVPLKEDELIGLYITTEYVDIPGDLESDYNAENLTGSKTGEDSQSLYEELGRSTGEDSQSLYEELGRSAGMDSCRLYGELDGKSGKLRFEGVEGYEFLYVPRMQEDGGEAYAANMVSDIFYDMSIVVKDQDVEMKGVVAFDNDGTDLRVFYFNPVYMTQKGEIYLISGSGMSNDISSPAEFSHSVTTENTENGVTSSGSKRFSVEIRSQSPVVTAVFTQMDREGKVLRRDEYSFDGLPEIYSRVEGEAYTVVMQEDGEGERHYDILNREDTGYRVLGISKDLSPVIRPFYMQIK